MQIKESKYHFFIYPNKYKEKNKLILLLYIFIIILLMSDIPETTKYQ